MLVFLSHFLLGRRNVISGLGFAEVLVVLIILLLFFGSKELPHFIRESGRLLAKIRRYSNKVRQELDDVVKVTNVEENFHDEIGEKKKKIRSESLSKRKALDEKERLSKADQIMKFFFNTEEFKKSSVIMLYAATKTEVTTQECVSQILSMGKRVIIPYCYPNSAEMGIAEIKNYETDLKIGQYNILEPIQELRDNFLKSDIQLVVCPGVAFDKNGGRLGRGKGCYDYFLKEIKGKVTIVGFAFHCQILEEPLPFDYHDVPADKIITEEGMISL